MNSADPASQPAAQAVARARTLLGVQTLLGMRTLHGIGAREGGEARAGHGVHPMEKPDAATDILAERLLSDGYTNSNHLLRIGQGRVVMRIGNPRASQLGIDRLREAAVWRLAAREGLSPALLAFDATCGDAVSQFIDVPTAAELLAAAATMGADERPPSAPMTEPGLLRIAAALRRTHALQVDAPPIDPADVIARHLALRLEAGFDWPSWVVPLLARLRAHPELQAARRAPRLTHHDFNPWNLLWPAEGELLVLDWEYAAPGDPLFDLVTVFAHWSLGADARAVLLAACDVSTAAQARLPALETLFHLREYTWAGAMLALGDVNPNVQAQFEREAGWLVADERSAWR